MRMVVSVVMVVIMRLFLGWIRFSGIRMRMFVVMAFMQMVRVINGCTMIVIMLNERKGL